MGLNLVRSFIYFAFWLVVKETDLHTKRTGHTEFVDKTSEAAKPISLEVPKVMDESQEAVDAGGSSSEPQGTASKKKLWRLLIQLFGFTILEAFSPFLFNQR